jgi:hypothetical protein
MAQVVEYQPCKPEALNSNSSTTKKKRVKCDVTLGHSKAEVAMIKPAEWLSRAEFVT